jgi:dienelactone hydrolase
MERHSSATLPANSSWRTLWQRCIGVMLLSALTPLLQAQVISSRPSHADHNYPFNSPAPVKTPASASQFDQWRAQIKSALFISDPLPTLAPKSFGSFSPAPGVIAERVTYGTNFGMRIPAIIYRSTDSHGKLPAMVVVDGHGGDKTSWYAFYTGILYARAGAVVVTYDPIGEDERNSERKSETREHDTVIKGPHSPERMGGLMVTDVMQAVSYLAQRPDVDAARIAVVGYSMGSFISAIAGAVDPRIHALVLSAGGDLDGNMGSWDHSSKIMCQAGPYRALSFLPDKSAILYALNQRRGASLILNGAIDPLVARPHHFEPFFTDLRVRVAALTGTHANLPESHFFAKVGHRTSWVTRQAALWLQNQLHFPNWSAAKINALGQTHISAWANATGAHINEGYAAEEREGGIRALATGIPNVPWADLQVLPEPTWQREKERFVWDAWVRHALAADGIRTDNQKAFYPESH